MPNMTIENDSCEVCGHRWSDHILGDDGEGFLQHQCWAWENNFCCGCKRRKPPETVVEFNSDKKRRRAREAYINKEYSNVSTTIILCQGDQGRLLASGFDQPKHLHPFQGKPLLARTISQVKRLTLKTSPIILNAEFTPQWRKFATDHELPIMLEPGKLPTQDFLDVLVHFREQWDTDGPTYFLFGDVVWSNRMISELYTNRDAEIFFSTRFSPTLGIGTWRAEIFGFRFLPSFHAQLDEMLQSRQMSPYHRAEDVWGLFHWLMDQRDDLPGEPEYLDAGEEDYTLDIDYEGDLKNLSVLESLADKDDAEAAAHA